MSRSGNEFIARTQGTQFTLYAACRTMGIPLSKEQEEFQDYLERKYGKLPKGGLNESNTRPRSN